MNTYSQSSASIQPRTNAPTFGNFATFGNILSNLVIYCTNTRLTICRANWRLSISSAIGSRPRHSLALARKNDEAAQVENHWLNAKSWKTATAVTSVEVAAFDPPSRALICGDVKKTENNMEKRRRKRWKRYTARRLIKKSCKLNRVSFFWTMLPKLLLGIAPCSRYILVIAERWSASQGRDFQ